MSNSRGFTLVEVMITLSILTVLIVVAIPYFGSFVRDSALDSIQNRLVATMSLTRSETINRRGAV